jgi:2-methylisocitrate lyase-like PEP mutase family enzyme
MEFPMTKAEEMRKKFKAMIAGDTMVTAPGCYDGLTATLISQAGFDCAYMTGAGTSIAKGYPDFGLMTMTEMVANADTVANAANCPVIADADTGYGNELNVTRTIHEYERAGVAGIHMEDQGFPKKCGHLDDKEIIPLEEYVAKIRAAVAARRDPNFQIIARTDSRAVLGFEEAIRRGNAALDAGADIVFVEAPQTIEELKAVPQQIKGPCLFNYVEGGKTPEIDLKTAVGMGFKITILPGFLLRQAILSCEEILGELKSSGEPPNRYKHISVRDMFNRFGANEWDKLRVEAGPSKQAAE